MISMFGLNLFYIDERTLESLLRHVFKAISYPFEDRVRLRDISCVEEAFTEDELNELIAKESKANTAEVDKLTRSDGGNSDGTTDILQGLRLNMNTNVLGEEKKRLERKRIKVAQANLSR